MATFLEGGGSMSPLLSQLLQSALKYPPKEDSYNLAPPNGTTQTHYPGLADLSFQMK